jgi:hypothetical protein
MCTDYTTLGPASWGGKGKTMSDATRRGKRAAVAAVAATAVGSAAAPIISPGTAAASQGQCSGGRLCLWEDGGFNSDYGYRVATEDLDWSNNTYITSTRGLNDSVSAVWNNRGGWAKLFRNIGGGGDTLCFAPGAAVSDLTRVTIQGTTDWSNRASGHRLYGTGQPSGCDTVEREQGCSL